jgi:hypothetical protein
MDLSKRRSAKIEADCRKPLASRKMSAHLFLNCGGQ